MTAIVAWERKKEKKKSIDFVMPTAWMVYLTKLLDEQVVSLALLVMKTTMMTMLTHLCLIIAAYHRP